LSFRLLLGAVGLKQLCQLTLAGCRLQHFQY
jgi:hypothetical protein